MQRELPPRQRDRKALLNRYEFHTRNCPDCLGVRSVASALLGSSTVSVPVPERLVMLKSKPSDEWHHVICRQPANIREVAERATLSH